MAGKLERMHTAEHILSAVMKQNYQAPRNLEFHLNEKKTKCDYAPKRPITERDIRDIEESVNEEIAKDHPVSAFFLPREEAGKYDLWKVPPDHRKIRIVKIGDFDETPCGGKHVSNTGEIGRFQISSFEMKENGRVRIRFKLH